MKTNINFLLIIFLAVFFWACSKESANVDNGGSEAGKGGSLARFTVAGDHLYTVDESELKVFSLSDPEDPQLVNNKYVGFGVETIFPKNDVLFLGTETGMYIYGIDQPESPNHISFFEHVQACDPVVADDDYAYVTLSSGNQRCFRNVNELQVVDISDLYNPKLEVTKSMTSPLGLAIHNDTLYVCDKGIKVLDVAEPNNIDQLYYFSNIEARDVIYHNNKLFVIGDDGFHQYRISNGEMVKISDILLGE